MLPFKLVYADGYDMDLGDHVFPAVKYKLIREKLLKDKIAEPADFIAPEPASDPDVLRVHSQEYVYKLKHGKLSYLEILRLEIPYSPQVVAAFWLSAGGSILAAEHALSDGIAFNTTGGGFHHAFPDHGEGFCMLNDVAIAIRRLQYDKTIETAMVVDCDVHQGNGTAAIFGGDATVFTLSIHQEHNYPFPKPPSNIDINLPDRVRDAEYLEILESHLRRALKDFEPKMISYLAGADPYREDQLGGLALTKEGLKQRDRLVLEMARSRQIPVMVTFAGGYARKVEDTVEIHVNTIVAAREVAQGVRAQG